MAGFVQFDPDKWEPEEPEGVAKVAKVAKVEGGLATLAGLAALPDEITRAVARLSRQNAPRGVDAKAWAVAAEDAARLVSEGWALSAMRLGWSALDLFGAVADKGGDAAADGLAVKLQGRPLVALCASFATVRDGPSARSFIYRRNASDEGRRLLWELGRGR